MGVDIDAGYRFERERERGGCMSACAHIRIWYDMKEGRVGERGKMRGKAYADHLNETLSTFYYIGVVWHLPLCTLRSGSILGPTSTGVISYGNIELRKWAVILTRKSAKAWLHSTTRRDINLTVKSLWRRWYSHKRNRWNKCWGEKKETG